MIQPVILPDSEQRRIAITTENHAFVWASAGAGKTHTLTLRALYLLLKAPFLGNVRDFPEIAHLYHKSDRRVRLKAARAAIRSLVLTTFTRKAAAEMQTRLYGYLDLLASSPTRTELAKNLAGNRPDPLFEEICDELSARLSGAADLEAGYQALRQGAEALAELASELQIATIHSVAATILKRRLLESKIPVTARFAEENEDDGGNLDELLVNLWWQKEAFTDARLQKDLEKLLAKVSSYQVRLWFSKICRYREIATRLDAWERPDPSQVDRCLAACVEFGNRLKDVNGKRIAANGQRLVALASALQARDFHTSSWSELCNFVCENRTNLFFDGSNTAKGVKSLIQNLPPHVSVYFQSLECIYPILMKMCLFEELGEEWAAWKNVVKSFLDWSQTKGVEALGIVGFDEMIRRAADLLKKQPHVRQSERRRLRALLVDEFQDTDPEQLRLLTALLRKQDSRDHEILGFFVGDKKQSIYRFRGADVESTVSFATNYQLLTNCSLPVERLFLSATFRSLPSITNAVNRLFSTELTLVNEKEEELQPVRQASGKPPEWIWIESDDPSKPLTAGKARAMAAAETARLIAEYMSQPEADSGDAAAASRKYSDILVLVRSGRELDALLPVLQEAGIPVISSGARTLYRQPEVSDVLNLLIALYNPLDTLAVGALLRSPLIQISDPDIYRLIKSIPPSRLIHGNDPLPDFLSKPAASRIETLRLLAASRHSSSLSEWLLEIRKVLPLAAYTDPLDREGRAFARINRLLEAFRSEMAADPSDPLTWLLRQRGRAGDAGRFDVDFGEDVGDADESIDAVRVMTVHKAKGLEARYVIVYGWAAILNETQVVANHRSSLVIRRSNGGLRGPSCEPTQDIEFSLPWGPVMIQSEQLQTAAREEEASTRAEALRLAYVATTRPREQLTLICAVSRNLQLPHQIKALPRTTGPAWDGLLQIRTHGAGAEGSRDQSGAPPLADRRRYLAFWKERYEKLEAWPDFALARPSDASASRRQTEIAATKIQSPDPMITGQLVHAYLERWLLEESFKPEKLTRLWKRLERAPEESRLAAEKALNEFYSGSYKARVQRAQVIGRELPFYMAKDGRYWNGVIDLVLEEDGQICGVDYKTSAEKEQLPESYAQQAAVYTEVLRRLFPDKRVKFEFWWLGPQDTGTA